MPTVTGITGIIINQITTRTGTWFQLKSRTWVYVPEVISTFLVGAQGNFSGEKKQQKGCKPFIYAKEYSIPEYFDSEKVISKLMGYLDRINFKNKALLKIQIILNFLVYLFVIGKLALIKKISKWKSEKILHYCKNPYELYLNGHLDYPSADVIAQALMIDEKQKVYPLAFFLLEHAYKNGKESVKVEELYSAVNKRLREEISLDEFIKIISSREKMVLVDDKVFLNRVYYLKQKCLEIVSKKNFPSLSLSGLPEQLSGILSWKYSVLTGTAGTGKTTLVRQLKDSKLKVIFTATTGKAAKRIDESATTIHDLLGYGPKGFRKDRIDADVVVIDEASMLTWQILYHALTKIDGHIIFVGDPEQTSPVQGSAVFQELINAMPEGSVKKLDVVYRTQKNERVLMKLNRYSAIQKIVSLSSYMERKNYNWQIITPLKRTAYDINLRLQHKFRGNGDDSIFKVGDRVMFLKNLRVDGEFIVSNGQVGTVAGRDDRYYVVKFGDKLINCLPEEIDLSYAITIHKATGSEYDYVICYIPYGVNGEFLTDDLIKVALTRSKARTYVICEDVNTLQKLKNYVSSLKTMS